MNGFDASDSRTIKCVARCALALFAYAAMGGSALPADDQKSIIVWIEQRTDVPQGAARIKCGCINSVYEISTDQAGPLGFDVEEKAEAVQERGGEIRVAESDIQSMRDTNNELPWGLRALGFETDAKNAKKGSLPKKAEHKRVFVVDTAMALRRLGDDAVASVVDIDLDASDSRGCESAAACSSDTWFASDWTHATGLAAVAAARSGKANTLMSGVSPGTKVVAVRVLFMNGGTETASPSGVARGLCHIAGIAKPGDAIVLAWTTQREVCPESENTKSLWTAPIKILQNLSEKGIHVTIAAGDTETSSRAFPVCAAGKNIHRVSAFGANYEIAKGASVGYHVSAAAPAWLPVETFRKDVVRVAGTSAAAAMAGGALVSGGVVDAKKCGTVKRGEKNAAVPRVCVSWEKEPRR